MFCVEECGRGRWTADELGGGGNNGTGFFPSSDILVYCVRWELDDFF